MAGRQTARSVVVRLVDIFRREGFDGASLTVLAQGTGLGRASLYHHFPEGKAAMARAAYERASRDFTRAVLAPLAGTAPPAERLARMAAGLDAFYEGGRAACLIDVFSIGGAREQFAKEVGEAVAYWRDAIARVLEAAGISRGEAQVRAEEGIVAIEGALVVARATGATEPFRRVLDGLVARLTATK